MSYLTAQISVASSGDNTVVAAGAAGTTIQVHGYVLVAAGAVTARWAAGTGTGTPLSGAMSLITGVPLVVPYCDLGAGRVTHWITVPAATLLNLSLGGAVQVSGHIIYSIL